MNKVILIGRTTKGLELKTTQNQKQYVEFDLAVDNGKDKDGNSLPATFITCVAWEKRAETLSVYLHKGNRIGLTGRWKVDKYQTENGENRYKNYLLIEEFEFLEPKSKDNFVPSEPVSNDKQQEQIENPYAGFGNSITAEDLDSGMELPF